MRAGQYGEARDRLATGFREHGAESTSRGGQILGAQPGGLGGGSVELEPAGPGVEGADADQPGRAGRRGVERRPSMHVVARQADVAQQMGIHLPQVPAVGVPAKPPDPAPLLSLFDLVRGLPP